MKYVDLGFSWCRNWILSVRFVLLFSWMVAILLPCRLEALENIEIYLAGYGMATQPSNGGLILNGQRILDEKIRGDVGLGFKIGLFPSFLHGYLGIELEPFGHHNSLSFPKGQSGTSMRQGQASLITYNSMVNLLLRYPGRFVRPYIGIGGGLSNGILYHADIPGRNNKNLETGTAPGYQFFGGMQLIITNHWFVFGEYKYNAAHYHWNQLSLNFQSEYFLGGVGYSF